MGTWCATHRMGVLAPVRNSESRLVKSAVESRASGFQGWLFLGLPVVDPPVTEARVQSMLMPPFLLTGVPLVPLCLREQMNLLRASLSSAIRLRTDNSMWGLNGEVHICVVVGDPK